MADQTLLDKLAALLRGTPGAQPAQAMPQQPQIGGMAGQAQQLIQSRPYQLHVQEAQAMGQQPMSPEQFMAQGR